MNSKTIEEKTRNLLTEEQLKKIRKPSAVNFVRPNAPGEPFKIVENNNQIGTINTDQCDAECIARMLSANRRGIDSTMAEDIIFNVSAVLAHNWEINMYLNVILYQILNPESSDQDIKERFLQVFDVVAGNALAASTFDIGFKDIPFEDTQRII